MIGRHGVGVRILLAGGRREDNRDRVQLLRRGCLRGLGYWGHRGQLTGGRGPGHGGRRPHRRVRRGLRGRELEAARGHEEGVEAGGVGARGARAVVQVRDLLVARPRRHLRHQLRLARGAEEVRGQGAAVGQQVLMTEDVLTRVGGRGVSLPPRCARVPSP